ncbi:X-linked retinitis pigmentosa GTPase regulator isoform X2 [Nilaparvata lugens]|uniref:X-linked retinitis pigmentosa GTPase regulator isoform X2 n=1 Tax=Nilaparvata lugens TaxID=108931 RepID=UPI00193D1C34|nr:X-linked retinitis pigmentosa GTPase regulator isoform X2 [Nilaparvata lugens]
MGEEENEIPDTGAVFTFGRSRFAENLPSHFFIRNDPVVDISCGEEHTLVVCQNGRVFGFGGNEFGQLGLGTTSPVSKPSCIKSLKPEKVKRIICGKTHSLALTGNGKLYAWGNNSDCQLGIGSEENCSTPKQVELNDVNEPIASLTAGAQHSALLTDGGKVYIWGSNSCGQLGLSDGIKKCSKPTRLAVKEKVLQIACGYMHTLMLTEEKYLLVFGEGSSGKLGLGGTSSVPMPIPLKFDKNVTSIAAGGNHSLALTDEGDVYAWGNNEHGQLGFSEEKTEITNPILVTPLLNVRVAQIACGQSHSAFTSDNGELYTCGESKYGKLCSDSELKSDIMGSRTLPFKVNRFKTLKVQKVACGGCHTMVLAIPTNRQKQGQVNGIVDKTNKENDLAKKGISETSIEGLSDISSTPRKTSRTSLPPLQKVVIPKKEPDSPESLPNDFNMKTNGEEKLIGDDKQNENRTTEENPQENCKNSPTSVRNDIITETPKEEYIMNEELPENGDTVSNDGSDASNNKELEEKNNKEDPAPKETPITPDNISDETGSAADLSSTISVISPASERKVDTTSSAKSQPEDEIKEDTNAHQEEIEKSESPENKDEATPENKKEKETNDETKRKSPKQKDKKGSKKQTSSVCVIL